MANQLQLFMNREDEITFVRVLARQVLEVYPRTVPPDWKTFRANEANFDLFPPEDVYLVASDIGAALVDKVKRGPDKGNWRVDEVRSPVIYWERCTVNEDEELVSGQLWGQLDVTPETGRREVASERFRARFMEIETWVRKTFRKGDPKGFWVGPATARLLKHGEITLRENHHFGREIRVHR